MSTPIAPLEGRTCRSDIHEQPVPAVVLGAFDGSKVNGREPEPDSAYCLRCAVMLHDVGCFTPDDPAAVIPTIDEFLARRDRGEIDTNGQPR